MEGGGRGMDHMSSICLQEWTGRRAGYGRREPPVGRWGEATAHLPTANVDVRLAAGADLVAVRKLGWLELPRLEQVRRTTHLLRVARRRGDRDRLSTATGPSTATGGGRRRRQASGRRRRQGCRLGGVARALAHLGPGRDGPCLARKLVVGAGDGGLEDGGGRLGHRLLGGLGGLGGRLTIHGHDPITHHAAVRPRRLRVRPGFGDDVGGRCAAAALRMADVVCVGWRLCWRAARLLGGGEADGCQRDGRL